MKKDELAECVGRLFEVEAAKLEPESEPEQPEIVVGVAVEADDVSADDVSAVADGGPYAMGEWNGKPQWRCKLCPWDTLEGEAAMLDHMATRHKPPAPRVSILVADARGNPVAR